ncbi:MAG TPA: TIGR04283 family arsenosugar biosynthesis glycosyltransferase [Ktedonobacteraceae bacterium]
MRFSIIMPVVNEEVVLEQQRSHLVSLCSHHDCELLIVDGGSTDRTLEIAQRFGTVIISQRGRATQMNAGVAAATGEVLLFLHADTLLPGDAFCAIEQALTARDVVGGAFQICFNCNQWPYRLVAWTANLRSRLCKIFTGDQAYFVRSTSFNTIGGFPDQPLMEDLELITRLRNTGKVVLLPQYVTTSARRHEKMGLARSVLLMWYLRTLYRFGTSPARLQRMYIDVR